MQDDRTAFLLRKRELMPLTEAEQAELAATPEFVGERDGNGNFVGGVMVVPRRSGDYNEQLAAFAKLQFMDHDATPDEIQAFVNGGKAPTPHDQAPVADEPPVEPQATVAADPGTPPPPVAVPVSAPPPAAAPVAPVGTPTATDDELIEVFDPSYPHDPPKKIRRSLWEKQQRKQRLNSAKARAGRTIGRA
jgi:hypothetical protein